MSPFAKERSRSLAALGESALIDQIKSWLGPVSPKSPYGIGDDCAIFPGSRQPQVITVDPVIYGRHFDASVPARAVGAKLLKRNLSDIAAMGARPTVAVIALSLDPSVRIAWLRGFYQGLAACAREFGVLLVGGDIAQARGVLAASLTLLGHAVHPRLLTRSGASRSDWIYVTGELGGSLRGHHYTFTPRLAAGQWLAGQPVVSAMMDLSDGLAKDIHSLVPRGSRPALVAVSVPISAAARITSRHSRRPPLAHALSDGEDYELVFTLSGQAERSVFERRWSRHFPDIRLACIGQMVPALRAAQDGEVDLREFRGYEHLR